VDAFNAVAMLCRKLLLHLVFTHERSQNENATPRNITFAQAVQYLLQNGIITAANEPLALGIKPLATGRITSSLTSLGKMLKRSHCSHTTYL
jgi:hypothetical protein